MQQNIIFVKMDMFWASFIILPETHEQSVCPTLIDGHTDTLKNSNAHWCWQQLPALLSLVKDMTNYVINVRLLG